MRDATKRHLPSFWTGVLSVFDFWGTSLPTPEEMGLGCHEPEDEPARESDSARLRSDWERIFGDFRRAVDREAGALKP